MRDRTKFEGIVRSIVAQIFSKSWIGSRPRIGLRDVAGRGVERAVGRGRERRRREFLPVRRPTCSTPIFSFFLFSPVFRSNEGRMSQERVRPRDKFLTLGKFAALSFVLGQIKENEIVSLKFIDDPTVYQQLFYCLVLFVFYVQRAQTEVKRNDASRILIRTKCTDGNQCMPRQKEDRQREDISSSVITSLRRGHRDVRLNHADYYCPCEQQSQGRSLIFLLSSLCSRSVSPQNDLFFFLQKRSSLLVKSIYTWIFTL